MENRKGGIRTMKTDAELLMKSRGKNAQIDAYANRQPQTAPQKPPKTKYLAVLFAAILLVAGAGFFVYKTISRGGAEDKRRELPIPRPFISAQTQKLRIQKKDYTGLALGLEDLQKLDGITYAPLVLFDAETNDFLGSAQDFFRILRSVPPQSFFDGLGKRWDLYALDGDFVLIFEVKNKEKTLGALLNSEDEILNAFLPLIGAENAGSAAFEDIVIDNMDARIARITPDGSKALAYAVVISNKYLVMATSEKSFRQALKRLVASQNIL